MIRSREIAQACQENVVFMTLSGDSLPHFTTVASFVRELKDEIAHLFTQVLLLCEAQGLIEREMFAIDGVKLHAAAFGSDHAKHKDLQSFPSKERCWLGLARCFRCRNLLFKQPAVRVMRTSHWLL